jgi:hypothetical protein
MANCTIYKLRCGLIERKFKSLVHPLGKDVTIGKRYRNLSGTEFGVKWQGRTKLDKLSNVLVGRIYCLLERLTIQRKIRYYGGCNHAMLHVV